MGIVNIIFTSLLFGIGIYILIFRQILRVTSLSLWFKFQELHEIGIDKYLILNPELFPSSNVKIILNRHPEMLEEMKISNFLKRIFIYKLSFAIFIIIGILFGVFTALYN